MAQLMYFSAHKIVNRLTEVIVSHIHSTMIIFKQIIIVISYLVRPGLVNLLKFICASVQVLYF
jgi:hypothetical protein